MSDDLPATPFGPVQPDYAALPPVADEWSVPALFASLWADGDDDDRAMIDRTLAARRAAAEPVVFTFD